MTVIQVETLIIFIDNYVTHFIDEVTFGSSYTQEHRMSTSTFDTLSEKKFGVAV